MSAHTPGPWRWEFNGEHRRLHLVGGCPRYDLTIMDFERWGMNGATMRLRDTAHDGMQLLYRVHERPDWIAPEPGREHHRGWHQLLTHPDARLIAAAPETAAERDRLREVNAELVAALQVAAKALRSARYSEMPAYEVARAAITKATGGEA
jgi:hypothetical protein